MDANGNYDNTDLAAVRKAIARGEKTVVFADRTITYRNMDELIQAARLIEAQMSTQSRAITAYSRKGV